MTDSHSSSLAGRHVVITGGLGALGSAVVQAFARAGAACHLPVRRLAGEVTAPAVHLALGVDLTDEAAVEQFYSTLPELWASVHLAGGFRAAPIAETSLGDLRQQLDVNLVTVFLCCREAVKRMRGSGAGRIVNVAARVVESPAAGMTAYVAAKGAVAALTRALAVETRRTGILVNAVLPSVIDTPANRAAMPDADHARWPTPDQIARTIVWLASPENTLTSGALVPVYGHT
jgi:NAD(P)-dependent dehydrogenase (short-subunit alcohol dehydrogenase family)